MRMSEENKTLIRRLLVENANGVLVTFVKVDGTQRTINATLHPDILPNEEGRKEGSRSSSETSIAVFDLAKQEWRSFRWDSVSDVAITFKE